MTKYAAVTRGKGELELLIICVKRCYAPLVTHVRIQTKATFVRRAPMAKTR